VPRYSGLTLSLMPSLSAWMAGNVPIVSVLVSSIYASQPPKTARADVEMVTAGLGAYQAEAPRPQADR